MRVPTKTWGWMYTTHPVHANTVLEHLHPESSQLVGLVRLSGTFYSSYPIAPKSHQRIVEDKRNSANHHRGMIHSSLSSRVGTNYVPTDEEIAQIGELLSGPALTLANLKAAMERNKAEYKELFSQHEELTREIAEYRALISPVRRLPVDILQEIFCHCLVTEHNALMSHHDAPVLLARICSSWRSIAFSTPELWSSIHIPVPPLSRSRFFHQHLDDEAYKTDTTNFVAKRSAAAREWLARSCACPLSISLHDADASLSYNTHCDALLASFMPFSSRWKSVSVTASAINLKPVANLAAADVPLLESLTLTIINTTPPMHWLPDSSPNIITWAKSAVIRAPHLRQISFIRIFEEFATFPLNWAKLTKLSLEGTSRGLAKNMTIYKIAPLLVMCKQLVEVRLEISRTQGVQDSCTFFTSSISLPHLLTLSMHDCGDGLCWFFDLLQVPLLEHFEYHTDASPGPTAGVLALLSQTGNTLRSFVTDFQIFTKSEFTEALQHCHGLTSLSNNYAHLVDMGFPRYRVQHFDDEFLELLNTTNGDYILPELEVLECFPPAGFSDAALLDLIKSRSRKGGLFPTHAKLKRVSVSFNRQQDLPLKDELQPLIQDGLQVQLSYAPPPPRVQFSASDGIDAPAAFPSYHHLF
ncbi:hypothetical protein BDZ97DRAFT_1913565 [Flammula alnicola]|nr:hypothetical protein BDZ97DRAFT_1913565 [Flammula alnicola]